MSALILPALIGLLRFLLNLLIGFLAIALLALPWLLRLAALLLFVSGLLAAILIVQTVYGSFTPTVPLLALEAASIFLLLAPTLFALDRQRSVWAAFALSGILAWLMWRFIPHLLGWQYGMLFLQALPALLGGLLLITLSIRFRLRRKNYEYTTP